MDMNRQLKIYIFFQHQIVTVTADGVTMEKDLKLDTNWEMAGVVKGYE